MAGSTKGSLGLPPARRLRQSRDFAAIKLHGRRYSLGCVIINWRQEVPGITGPQLGVVVSRKVGGAVERNRAKRWFREVFRQHQHELPRDLRLVVIARPSIGGKVFAQVERDLLAALKYAKLWPPAAATPTQAT